MEWSAKALRALEIIVNELRVIEVDFPASYAAVLLFVATQEKFTKTFPTVSEVSDNLGLSRGTGSRIVLSMADRRLGKSRIGDDRPSGSRQSLGLLERFPDGTDLRMIRVRLTPKGKGLMNRLVRAADQ